MNSRSCPQLSQAASLNYRRPNARALKTRVLRCKQPVASAVLSRDAELQASAGHTSSGEELAAKVRADDAQYIVQTYKRAPEVFTHGEGCYLFDTAGKSYLDFAAGIAVNVLGHSDPEWAKCVSQQAQLLAHTSNLYHSPAGAALARLLVEGCPFADRVFFANSGTEANEAAIKFARKYQRVRWEAAKGALPRAPWARPPTEFVAFEDGFHGRTMGALALTWKEGYRAPFQPVMPGARFAPYGDLAAAKRLIRKGRTAAVFAEPVQGEGGIHAASAAFLQGLREACDEAGALLVFDEVQCGLGRTGSLWAHQAAGVRPDIMTAAKPLAGGLPIGALLCTDAVAAALQPGDHGSTFAGGPLVTAVARHVVQRVQQPAFLAAVAQRGERLRAQLREATAGCAAVLDVRGVGLLCGVQLAFQAGPVVEAARAAGLLVITAGKGDIVRLVPPLVVSEAEVDKAAAILGKVIKEVAAAKQ